MSWLESSGSHGRSSADTALNPVPDRGCQTSNNERLQHKWNVSGPEQDLRLDLERRTMVVC